ncbi:MAG: hypothetical protein MK081_13830 [Flavobacteriales bacterium]|nr:hypothetical protein [Flavobacteriales bacterium]
MKLESKPGESRKYMETRWLGKITTKFPEDLSDDEIKSFIEDFNLYFVYLVDNRAWNARRQAVIHEINRREQAAVVATLQGLTGSMEKSSKSSRTLSLTAILFSLIIGGVSIYMQRQDSIIDREWMNIQEEGFRAIDSSMQYYGQQILKNTIVEDSLLITSSDTMSTVDPS